MYYEHVDYISFFCLKGRNILIIYYVSLNFKNLKENSFLLSYIEDTLKLRNICNANSYLYTLKLTKDFLLLIVKIEITSTHYLKEVQNLTLL